MQQLNLLPSGAPLFTTDLLINLAIGGVLAGVLMWHFSRFASTLSIVRFRTPIKEPEELACLFMAIAIGLGLGADQSVPTLASVVVILTIVALYKRSGNKVDKKSMFLSVRYDRKHGDGNFLQSVNETIKQQVLMQDLRRIDTAEDQVEATFFVDTSTKATWSPCWTSCGRPTPEST